MDWERLIRPDALIFFIPIVAIIVGGVVAVTKLIIKHRERMAMIEHGLDPDRRPPDEDQS